MQVIAATNRIDILDPALLRSGRLDRKIEFPLPGDTARARILEIHSRKMSIGPDVNFEEIARSTDEFNGAQLKAVCVEAGMIALREGATKLGHEHFISGIAEGESCLTSQVQAVGLTYTPNQYKVRRRMTSCTLLNRFSITSAIIRPTHILYTRNCLRIYFRLVQRTRLLSSYPREICPYLAGMTIQNQASLAQSAWGNHERGSSVDWPHRNEPNTVGRLF